MIRVALLLFALLALAPARADPVYQSQTYACTKAAQFAGTGAATTRIVQTANGAANSQIYICGWSVLATASSTLQFEYGTGTNCGTGTTAITPQFSLTAGNPFVDHQPFYAGFLPIPAGNDLCIVVGTGAVPGLLYYTQF